MIDSEYLDVVDVSHRYPGRRTSTWSVRSKRSGDELGHVKFYGAWRCFAFFPSVQTIFNAGCLTDLARFCADETVAWRALHRRPGASQ